MKVAFVSNYFNHHQKPFCEEMYRMLGDGFTFISTSAMREERKKLGYSQGQTPDYVLISYENEEQKRKASFLINEADIVIAGASPDNIFRERLRRRKLTFRYCERPYKREFSCVRKLWHMFNFRRKNMFSNNVYLLCAGAYTARDFARLGMYRERMYKWGYFPECKEYRIDELFSQKKKNLILWCGRFIDWKHPDDVIRLAYKLKSNGYKFRLNMIGAGVMEEELKQMVKGYGLDNFVYFLGSMPPEQVRLYMQEAGIYLFTSDRKEGWGAVLNESMNSGCAVVASHAIGAVPYLLKDGQSGLVYHSGDTETLYDKVKYLLDNPDEQNRLCVNAYRVIQTEWNAKVAAARFAVLAESILAGNRSPELYETGPCSKEEIFKDV